MHSNILYHASEDPTVGAVPLQGNVLRSLVTPPTQVEGNILFVKRLTPQVLPNAASIVTFKAQ